MRRRVNSREWKIGYLSAVATVFKNDTGLYTMPRLYLHSYVNSYSPISCKKIKSDFLM